MSGASEGAIIALIEALLPESQADKQRGRQLFIDCQFKSD